MASVRNVLFIMCDQLRADHLSCYGHPRLATPNLDALAARGVRFERAYVTSTVCGPSRMSYYTGRYMASHGATWNRVPLSLDEWTMGDYLMPTGLAAHLTGKTHVIPDEAGIARYGIETESEKALFRAGRFAEIDRYDGHHEPHGESGYGDYLRAHGYPSERPWHDFVIGALDASGAAVSGWQMRHVHLPARVAAEHSETAYMTWRALEFIERQGDAPWVLHLSYIKPHWPYMAPRPYHALYRWADCVPPARHARENDAACHPVYRAFREHQWSRSFARDEVVERVRPVYMGLVKQIDDELGRLFERLERAGRMRDTLIVFTSDHGDLLGDHWLGEKEYFYEPVIRVPLVVYDPDPAADATRGRSERRLVENVDVLPTLLDALSIPIAAHRVEGRSLLPFTRAGAAPAGWRDAVFAELEYSFYEARRILGRRPGECRGLMVRTEEWKYVHWQGYGPQLWNLRDDPDELADLGAEPGLEGVRERMRARLLGWLASLKIRTTMNDDEVERRTNAAQAAGIHIGEW